MASLSRKIKNNLERITTNGDKLNILIHDTGMLILNHVKEHGDCSLAQELVNAMPASMRRTMLIQWFALFSPIVTKVDPTFTSKLRKEDDNLYNPIDLVAADATPFYKLAAETPEKPAMTFEQVVAMAKSLAKRAEKMAIEGKIVDEDIDSVKSFANTLAALEFKKAPVKKAPAKRKAPAKAKAKDKAAPAKDGVPA